MRPMLPGDPSVRHFHAMFEHDHGFVSRDLRQFFRQHSAVVCDDRFHETLTNQFFARRSIVSTIRIVDEAAYAVIAPAYDELQLIFHHRPITLFAIAQLLHGVSELAGALLDTLLKLFMRTPQSFLLLHALRDVSADSLV